MPSRPRGGQLLTRSLGWGEGLFRGVCLPFLSDPAPATDQVGNERSCQLPGMVTDLKAEQELQGGPIPTRGRGSSRACKCRCAREGGSTVVAVPVRSSAAGVHARGASGKSRGSLRRRPGRNVPSPLTRDPRPGGTPSPRCAGVSGSEAAFCPVGPGRRKTWPQSFSKMPTDCFLRLSREVIRVVGPRVSYESF